MNTLMREPTVGNDASVLALTRVFEAPAAAVFDLWTDATRIKEWSHPKEFTTPEFELDFRVGGSYCYCIRSKGHDGWAHGRFREIAVPNRIVMTFQWESGDPLTTRGRSLPSPSSPRATSGRGSLFARNRSDRRPSITATARAGARCSTPSPGRSSTHGPDPRRRSRLRQDDAYMLCAYSSRPISMRLISLVPAPIS